MEPVLNEVQELLKHTTHRFLGDRYPLDIRRRISSSTDGWSREIWTAFAEDLGILSIPFPVEFGGTGGGNRDVAVVMEEIGRHLVLEPYLSAVVIGGSLFGALGDEQRMAAIASGTLRTALAAYETRSCDDPIDVKTTIESGPDGAFMSGAKIMVRDVHNATHLLVTARRKGAVAGEDLDLMLVPFDADGIECRTYPTIDGGRAGDVHFHRVAVSDDMILVSGQSAVTLITDVLDRATLAICSEAVGIMQAMLDSTVAYTRERRQFGQPLSDFQVLRHRMVDMMIELEKARALTAVVCDQPTSPALVSAAFARTAQALRFVAQNALQLHGGIAMTEELDLGLYFKRAMVIESQFGTLDYHLARYERLSDALEQSAGAPGGPRQ